MKICLINNLYKPYSKGGAEKVVEMTAGGLREHGHEVFIITALPLRSFMQRMAAPCTRHEKPSAKGGSASGGELHANDPKLAFPNPSHPPLNLRGGEAGLPLNLRGEAIRPPLNFPPKADPPLAERGGEAIRPPLNLRGGEGELEDIKIYRIWSPNLIFYGNLGKLPVLLRAIWHFLDVFNFSCAAKVREIIKKEKPEIVFLHNLKGLSYLIPKFLRGQYLVLVPHDTQLVVPSGVILYGREQVLENRGLFAKTYEAINKFLFNDIKRVISPSQWLLDFYASHGFFKKANKVVLHNPTPMLHSMGVGERRRSPGRLNLLFVGQLEESKGILFLIRTLKESYKLQATSYKLTIVGDGSKRDEVEKLIAGDERFKYLGKLEGEALQKVYAEADFTVAPSLGFENCPTVILESIALGTPVIAAKLGGMPELVKDGQNGFLFESGNSQALEELLTRAQEVSWQELSKNAKISAEALSLNHYLDALIASV